MSNKEDFKDFEVMAEKQTLHPINLLFSRVNTSYLKKACSDFILINVPMQLYQKTPKNGKNTSL